MCLTRWHQVQLEDRQTLSDWVRALGKEAEREFVTLQAAKRQVLLSRFNEEEVPQMMDAIARAWHTEGIASKSAKHTFFKWLATSAPRCGAAAGVHALGQQASRGRFQIPCVTDAVAAHAPPIIK